MSLSRVIRQQAGDSSVHPLRDSHPQQRGFHSSKVKVLVYAERHGGASALRSQFTGSRRASGQPPRRMSHLPIQRLRDLTLIALACLPAAWACEAIGAPVPWLLGPLLASTLLAIITRSPWVVPKSAMSAAQVVVGLAIGLGFPPQAFAVVGSHLPALSLLVGVTAGLSLCNGFLLWRMAKTQKQRKKTKKIRKSPRKTQ